LPVVPLTLLVILFILILMGIVESVLHAQTISKIPIRVHVNGTRGKSSVVRLIAAGLRAGNIKTFAKTTGSSPRFIDEDGHDHVIQRFRPASIGEQIRMMYKFSKSSPEALVIECMAVQPQYQWVSEHKIVQSNYGVITNVRADHLEEMGYSLNHIAKSLSNTIPFNKKIFTSETESIEAINEKAMQNNCSVHVCEGCKLDDDYLDGFPFIEHPDNIALALEVCESIGVSRDVAIQGMRVLQPDPGALTVNRLKVDGKEIDFVNAFAANDPQSTIKTILMIKDNYKNKEMIIFLNTRSDRQLRTKQLLDLIFSRIKPAHLFVRGDNLEEQIKLAANRYGEIPCNLFEEATTQDEIIEEMKSLKNSYVIGIGNIVGWGESFMRKIRNTNVR